MSSVSRLNFRCNINIEKQKSVSSSDFKIENNCRHYEQQLHKTSEVRGRIAEEDIEIIFNFLQQKIKIDAQQPIYVTLFYNSELISSIIINTNKIYPNNNLFIIEEKTDTICSTVFVISTDKQHLKEIVFTANTHELSRVCGKAITGINS